jgi:hypothetical protein
MKRPCLGCRRLFEPPEMRRGRCDPCQRADWRDRNDRRDPVATAVYSSPEYRRARADVLAGATHCAWCRRPSSEVGPLTAGHIRPIRSDPDMAADPAGLAPSCRSCQEKEKHRR